jgi:hypothetical protein
MYIYVYVHMYIRTQLIEARRLSKDDPSALAANPYLLTIFTKYMEPKKAMYQENMVFLSQFVH